MCLNPDIRVFPLGRLRPTSKNNLKIFESILLLNALGAIYKSLTISLVVMSN